MEAWNRAGGKLFAVVIPGARSASPESIRQHALSFDGFRVRPSDAPE
jgi:hypothetical protein